MTYKMRKKLGVILTILGLVCALALFLVKESNQPIKVTSSFGSGYMGGWSDSTNEMLDMFIGVGILDAIVGVGLIIAPDRKKHREDEKLQY